MEGLCSRPKWLPPWLFYDAAGSRLFERITELPEYYLTRTEHGILKAHAEEMIARAAGDHALRMVELGAGSASKTSLLLRAAVERQDTVIYEPLDVSGSALDAAQARIEAEIPGVLVAPRVLDYTRDFSLDAPFHGERRMVLYIGSSVGNFEPHEAQKLLRNMLARLNRELGANFDVETFAHRARWNAERSRMEMHLESLGTQRVEIPALDLRLDFAKGETIHTENSYKYQPGQAEQMLGAAGFEAVRTWTDERGWFAVCLARAA
jgi:L-histidine N-alpha-methyltransferase